jgi:hypothetical protein
VFIRNRRSRSSPDRATCSATADRRRGRRRLPALGTTGRRRTARPRRRAAATPPVPIQSRSVFIPVSVNAASSASSPSPRLS